MGNYSFTISDGSTVLDTANLAVTCTLGTLWNGTLCKSAAADITVAPSCTIAANASTCNVNVTWTSTGLASPSIAQDGTEFSTSANQTTAVQRAISRNGLSMFLTQPGMHMFTINDGPSAGLTSNLDAATATASCVSGTTWNGTLCAASSSKVALPLPALTAVPNNYKNPSTLTWKAPEGFVSCSGNGFNTGNAASGSVVVAPKVETKYGVTCYDDLGNPSTASVTVGKIKVSY